jgi:hypothetical protein
MLIDLVEVRTFPPRAAAGLQGKVYVPGTGIDTAVAILSM